MWLVDAGRPRELLRSLWSPRSQWPLAEAGLLMQCAHASGLIGDPTDCRQVLVDEDDQQVAALPWLESIDLDSPPFCS
jgi:hypothetical protein